MDVLLSPSVSFSLPFKAIETHLVELLAKLSSVSFIMVYVLKVRVSLLHLNFSKY